MIYRCVGVLLLTAMGCCFGTARAGTCDAIVAAAEHDAARGFGGDVVVQLQSAILTGTSTDIEAALGRLRHQPLSGAGQMGNSGVINQMLSLAALSGRVEAIDTLVAAGASPNGEAGDHENAPLIAAAACGQVAALDALVRHGADVSERIATVTQRNVPSTPLEAAIGSGQTAATTWLLDHRADACSDEAHSRLKNFLRSSSITSRIAGDDMKRLTCSGT